MRHLARHNRLSLVCGCSGQGSPLRIDVPCSQCLTAEHQRCACVTDDLQRGFLPVVWLGCHFRLETEPLLRFGWLSGCLICGCAGCDWQLLDFGWSIRSFSNSLAAVFRSVLRCRVQRSRTFPPSSQRKHLNSLRVVFTTKLRPLIEFMAVGDLAASQNSRLCQVPGAGFARRALTGARHLA